MYNAIICFLVEWCKLFANIAHKQLYGATCVCIMNVYSWIYACLVWFCLVSFSNSSHTHINIYTSAGCTMVDAYGWECVCVSWPLSSIEYKSKSNSFDMDFFVFVQVVLYCSICSTSCSASILVPSNHSGNLYGTIKAFRWWFSLVVHPLRT